MFRTCSLTLVFRGVEQQVQVYQQVRNAAAHFVAQALVVAHAVEFRFFQELG